jgi:predicted ester cyclase
VVAFDQRSDISKKLHPGAERRQPLAGFDEEYVDIVDYIIRCTYKIWEQHGIGLIYSHYTHNAVQHGTDGTWYGRDQVIANTIQMQAAFPDLRLIADDVIWAGNDVESFKTSHRCTLVGRNTGYSIFGPPTGRQIVVRSVYNCVVRENRIHAEWAFNDELSLIRQLGLPIRETVKKLTPAPLDSIGVDAVGQVERVRGQTTPDVLPARTGELDSIDIEDLVRRSMHEIWNWRLLNKIDDYYGENYLYHGATGREAYGRGHYKAYVLSVLAMFPDAAMHIDDLFWNGNEREGYRTAVRWTLLGTHTGPGIYGEPTNRQISMRGITQHLVRSGRFIEEWTLFNELQVLQQLWCDR